MTDPRSDEWLTCAESPSYFLWHYGQVYDATVRGWLPFELWPAQIGVLRTLATQRLLIVLKARQLGLTWLGLGYALWLMLFRPAATVLLFSKRDDEAIYSLDFRLKGMYARLPIWMRARASVKDNRHEWMLSNGSTAMAFPTTGGDSYTATFVMADEADLMPDLGRLLGAVKPTIDAGGQLLLLGRSDKTNPQSEFKAIYRAAKSGAAAEWRAIFLPWSARPERTAEWYALQKADVQARTGALDELYEQYPATDAEALQPATLNKRFPPAWLGRAYRDQAQLNPVDGPPLEGAPALPELVIYKEPVAGRVYVIGADPAEGNPTSDESASSLVDRETGEEVATLSGQFEPAVFGANLAELSRYYHRAGVLVERNNHGHAVILWMKDNAKDVPLLTGLDDRPGWLETERSKSLAYDTTAEYLRAGNAKVHGLDSFSQLASVEGASLNAPTGQADDRAMAFVLAQMARSARGPQTVVNSYVR